MLSFLFSFIWKEGHHLFDHHEHQRCEVQLPGQKHLHDDRFSYEQCVICSSLLTNLKALQLRQYDESATFYFPAQIYNYRFYLARSAKFHFYLRGPPAQV